MDPTGTKPSESSWEANPLMPDRRGRVRHKVHTPAYASLNGTSTGMVVDLNEILDISEDGMSIQTSSPLEFKRNLSLCLDLSETKAYIHTSGQVVWSEPSGRSGVRFPEMPESSLRRLKEWLFLNAITACDHANVQTPPLEASTNDAEPAEPQRKVEPEIHGTPDYTAILAALTDVEREVESTGSDLDTALQLIVGRALIFTRTTGAAIALVRGSEMICVASAGSSVPELGVRLNAASGFSGECVRTGRLLRCDDSETDPRVDLESCHALGIRSMIAVPIRFGREVIGLLEIFSSRPNALTANDSGILQRLAQITAVAVTNAMQGSPRKGNLPDAPPASVRDLVSTESPATATMADKSAASHPRQILLYAVAATLVAVSVWLLAPSIQGGLRLWIGRRDGSQPRSKPQVPTTKSLVPIAAEASDLTGLRNLAEHGDPTAQFAVGARYATGEDVKQDYSEAVRWFSMAAEQGHIAAQATLGAYYWAGRGVSVDLGKAYFWSILAQTGGDQASKYRVAVLTSRMTRAQVIAAQQQASEWLTHHQAGNKNPSPPQ
jgi:TPR repeat protein/putative methionine-R-sulfoxide reductase with GAF domain